MIRDPDALRTVWLFGKPYWWGRLDDGRLTLEHAAWPGGDDEQPGVDLAEVVARMFSYPFPWPPEEESDA